MPSASARRHHEVLGPGDGHQVEDDARPLQPRRPRLDVALGQLDLGAEPLETLEVQIDRPAADGAAARHRDPGAAGPGHQRAEDEDGRPHGGDQLVRGFHRRHPRRGRGGDPLRLVDLGAEAPQQLDDRRHVGQPRHVLEDHGRLGQERRGQQRERGILGRADPYLAAQRNAALDQQPGRHVSTSSTRSYAQSRGGTTGTVVARIGGQERPEPLGVVVADLEQHGAAGPNEPGGVGEDPVNHRQPVGSPVEGEGRLPVAHLPGEARQGPARDVRRIGDDEIDAARQVRDRPEQVTLDHADPAGHAGGLDVRARPPRGRGRQLHRPHRALRPADGQRARDGARAGAEVEDERRALGAHRGRPLHEQLGLRTRDEDAGADHQPDAGELFGPQEVLERLVTGPPREPRLQLHQRVRRDPARGLQVERQPRRPEDPGQQQLGILARRRDAGGAQSRDGVPEDLAHARLGRHVSWARHGVTDSSWAARSASASPSISSSRSPSSTAGSRCNVRPIR